MKRVFITGASSGIGRQLALDYSRDGWQVFALGRDEPRLQALKAESKHIVICQCDQSDRAGLAILAERLPPLELLILNAGTCEYLDTVIPFDGERFARVIDTNLIGTGNVLAALLPKLVRGARLALVGSAVTLLPLTRSEAYGASKAGIDYLAACLRLDLYRHGIGVSLIQPGFVQTPLTDRNDFAMPTLMTVESASRRIRAGLAQGKNRITFPRRLHWSMKLLSILPDSWWVRLAQRMIR